MSRTTPTDDIATIRTNSSGANERARPMKSSRNDTESGLKKRKHSGSQRLGSPESPRCCMGVNFNISTIYGQGLSNRAFSE